jgi:hypothetical protein
MISFTVSEHVEYDIDADPCGGGKTEKRRRRGDRTQVGSTWSALLWASQSWPKRWPNYMHEPTLLGLKGCVRLPGIEREPFEAERARWLGLE